jgi:hypothetical protein
MVWIQFIATCGMRISISSRTIIEPRNFEHPHDPNKISALRNETAVGADIVRKPGSISLQSRTGIIRWATSTASA